MNWVVEGRRKQLHEVLPAKAWILALVHGTSAVGFAAMAGAPLGVPAPTRLYAACGFVLAATAAVLLAFGGRIGDRGLLALAGVRVAVAGVALASAQSAGASLFAGAGLIWVAIWITGFFPTRTVSLAFLAEIAVVVAAIAVNPEHLRVAVDAFPMLTGAVILSLLLSQVLNSLRHEARHDELTGLLNRRGLDQALRDLACSRFAGAASLVVVDLDGLKLVNDHAGHIAGDQMLLTFATELQTAARGVDLTARIGGDEFIAILPGLSAAEAKRWIEQLHDSSGVAWSFGVAERGVEESLETWLGRADRLMYAAKAATRASRLRQVPALA